MTRTARFGIFGGTFDPIHIGHLIAAEEARLAVGLDRVVFVPAGIPPHRERPPAAPAAQRTEMVRRAIAGHPAFDLDEREARAGRPVYTVETLEALRSDGGAARDLFFIVGADSLAEFQTWRDPDRILDLCTLVVVERPGTEWSGIDPALLRRVVRVPGARVGISAREIRERLASGLPVRYLVPDAVRAAIEEFGLYAR
jgi:nicotinate-nucleotide adenylyltransferase